MKIDCKVSKNPAKNTTFAAKIQKVIIQLIYNKKKQIYEKAIIFRGFYGTCVSFQLM